MSLPLCNSVLDPMKIFVFLILVAFGLVATAATATRDDIEIEDVDKSMEMDVFQQRNLRGSRGGGGGGGYNRGYQWNYNPYYPPYYYQPPQPRQQCCQRNVVCNRRRCFVQGCLQWGNPSCQHQIILPHNSHRGHL